MGKVWIVINRLSTIWKPDLFDKIKHEFFQDVAVSVQLYGCTTYTITNKLEKKLDEKYIKMLYSTILGAASNKTVVVRPPTSHLANLSSKMSKTYKSLFLK